MFKVTGQIVTFNCQNMKGHERSGQVRSGWSGFKIILTPPQKPDQRDNQYCQAMHSRHFRNISQYIQCDKIVCILLCVVVALQLWLHSIVWHFCFEGLKCNLNSHNDYADNLFVILFRLFLNWETLGIMTNFMPFSCFCLEKPVWW